jgi:cytochrome P450
MAESSSTLGPGQDPESLRNPQPLQKMMREFAPVFVADSPFGGQVAVVAKHEDILTVLRTPEIFSSMDEAVHIGQIRPLIPLQIDPPEHAKYRKLLDPLFAPKRMVDLEAGTRKLMSDLVDAVADKKRVNFHLHVAEPFPSTVFLQLLGLPVSRAKEFIALKDGIIRPPAETPEERTAHVNATGQKIYAVLEEVVEARLKEPQNDFISGFLSSEVDGEKLTPEDVIDICYLFFLAGLDTVTASLDCMISYLARNPEKRQQIIDDPSLIPGAVEEMLRWESPVQGVARIAIQDTVLNGCPISKGMMVSPLLGSANNDEAFWDRPDDIDFSRPQNKHLAFGGGVHRCLGSHLARLELRIGLEEWHKRVPNYRIADGVELMYSNGLRAIDNLELVWD